LSGSIPTTARRSTRPISSSLRENRDTYETEHRVVRQDTGEIRFVHEKCEHFRNAEGEIVRSVGMVHDVTERKKAEEALRHSERLYRAIGESIDYGVWVCDPEGRNIYASESFLRLVGLTQEQCPASGGETCSTPMTPSAR